MSDVPFASGHQIIDRKHIPAALDQVVAQMRTQKARTSRNDSAQAASFEAIHITRVARKARTSRPSFDAFGGL